MSKHLRTLGIGLIVIVTFSMVIGLSHRHSTSNVVAETLQAVGPMKWYRGNLHSHSNWSDGDDYLEMIALWYRDRGYDFLAISDHNLLPNKENWIAPAKANGGLVAFEKLQKQFPKDWINVRIKNGSEQVRLKRFDEVADKFNEKEKFLLIQGEEISDGFRQSPIHLNANNVVDVIPPMNGSSVTNVIQNNVDALIAQRERTGRTMMIHLNHPNFGWGVTAEDLAPVRGLNFFEIYSGHPLVNNPGDAIHASTERMWDIINTLRLKQFDLPLLYGLAVDDGHSYHMIPSRNSEPGRGWVMVLSSQLDPAALIQAMEAGRFYASSGVTLEKIEVTPTRLEVVISPHNDVQYKIEFIGSRKGCDISSELCDIIDSRSPPITKKYSLDVGDVFKSEIGTRSTYHFSGDELYVRAKVTSSRNHPNPSTVGDFECAWTQPVRP